MEQSSNKLEPHLQRVVDAGVSGIDIMHGQLKLDMLEAEGSLQDAQEVEAASGEAMDSMERKYWEGYYEALEYVYKMTYDISFAVAEHEALNA